SETIERLEQVELALRLQGFIRRVETGAIYRDNKSLFNPKHAIDQFLLDDLRAARDLISPERSVDGLRRIHALIGKFLFSRYLLDKGIIGSDYLRKNGLLKASNATNVQSLLDFLSSVLMDRGRNLEALFQVLQRDFNGSLFGNQLDSPVTDVEVDY